MLCGVQFSERQNRCLNTGRALPSERPADSQNKKDIHEKADPFYFFPFWKLCMCSQCVFNTQNLDYSERGKKPCFWGSISILAEETNPPEQPTGMQVTVTTHSLNGWGDCIVSCHGHDLYNKVAIFVGCLCCLLLHKTIYVKWALLG